MDKRLELNMMLENIMNNTFSSLSRQNLGQVGTNTHDRFAKIEYAAGYPEEIDIQMYYDQWKRNGVAKRVVSAFPTATWKTKPDVYENEDQDNITAFETTWKELDRRVGINAAMASADKLCGIGRFGVILLGIDDGKELHEPIDGFDEDFLSTEPGSASPKHRVTFARAVSERFVRIEKFVHDHLDPRNGLPEQYSVQLGAVTDGAAEQSDQQVDYYTVHWHRIIHITEETDETPVYASPRMQPVFNDLLDVLKISAGSPEAYWQAALPGLTFKLDPGYEGIDEESLRSQMDEYATNMRRYISTVGVTVNTLAPNVSDPIPHIDQKMTMISIGTEIPKRILMGTEEGKLAGDQDGHSWDDRVMARRINHVEPHIIRRTVEHLRRMGCLEQLEDVQVSWGSPHVATELEQAETGKVITEAIALFVSSGSETLMSFGDFLHLIMKRPIEEVEEIISKIEFDDEPGILAEISDSRMEASADKAMEREQAMSQMGIDDSEDEDEDDDE